MNMFVDLLKSYTMITLLNSLIIVLNGSRCNLVICCYKKEELSP